MVQDLLEKAENEDVIDEQLLIDGNNLIKT
jgi:hypothetical protein